MFGVQVMKYDFDDQNKLNPTTRIYMFEQLDYRYDPIKRPSHVHIVHYLGPIVCLIEQMQSHFIIKKTPAEVHFTKFCIQNPLGELLTYASSIKISYSHETGLIWYSKGEPLSGL